MRNSSRLCLRLFGIVGLLYSRFGLGPLSLGPGGNARMDQAPLGFTLESLGVVPGVSRAGVVKVPRCTPKYFPYQVPLHSRQPLASVCRQKVFSLTHLQARSDSVLQEICLSCL